MAAKMNVMFTLAVLAAALVHCSVAQRTHVVGDASGWTIPSGGAITYTNWASSQSFTVNDILVFTFPTGAHNVAEVTRASFNSCNTANPISVASNGPANITLRAAGEHFYICTFPQHCNDGMKLAINVSAAPSTAPPPHPPAASNPSPAPEPATPSSSSVSPPAASPAPSPSRTPETYIVGNALGWTVPPSGHGPNPYQVWASNKTFSVGDILVFNFRNGTHDVAELSSKAAYDSCNFSAASNPITTPPARITLTAPGEHFYVCTFPKHCSLGQKLAINVTGASATPSPAGVTAPPPPNSAASVAGAVMPITLLAVALAFLY